MDKTIAPVVAAASACLLAIGAGCSPASNPADSAGRGGSAGSLGAGGAPTGATVHCNIASIISNHCTLCHGGPPARYGAPMTLMSPGDFHGRASNGQPIHQRAIALLQASDRTTMPPIGTPAYETLAAEQRSNLLQWLKDGAHADPSGCRITDP